MKVSELLEKPENWCQGVNARDNCGTLIDCFSDRAACWCLNGAVHKCYYNIDVRHDIAELNSAMRKLRKVVGLDFVGWNDEEERTHAEVLEAVKKAGI